ncbi:MAG: YbjN domain-containing protein [Ahrensia sp.]|nr:YbjN domain-containing protein [Ahrensia sp.]
MSLLDFDFERLAHPVDVIEHVAHALEWNFERTGDDEIAVAVAGHWSNYHASFAWMPDHESLHFSCAFDLTVAKNRSNELLKLLSLINEQLLIGHFDFWEKEGAIMFRHSLLLAGGAEATEAQVAMMMSSALETCESYFQAFQTVVWSGVGAREAMSHAMFETKGEA